MSVEQAREGGGGSVQGSNLTATVATTNQYRVVRKTVSFAYYKNIKNEFPTSVVSTIIYPCESNLT